MARTVLALTLAIASACGSADLDPGLVAAAGPAAVGPAALQDGNGLSRNGLSRNGLSRNGLSRNGLSRNGLASAEFQAWFDADPATADEVMRYVVRCAVPAGQTLSFTSPSTGVAYAWAGDLGLAPGWASGLEATEPEEQVITACLASHVNKFGIRVEMSVLGRGATGTPIPVGADELSTFSQREGCFFGNLFRDEGVYVGLDHQIWDASYSSVRACAFDIFGTGPSADCPPVNNVGPCALICAPGAAGQGYASCTTWVSGASAWKSYLPISTRIRPSDVYRCGDGVCQFTESCGTDATAASCRSDCGKCVGTTSTSLTSSSKTTRTTR